MNNTTKPAEVVAAKFYTAAHLQTLLDVSESTIQRLRDAGAIPGFTKVGRCSRWQRDAVDAWIAAGCPSPASKSRAG